MTLLVILTSFFVLCLLAALFLSRLLSRVKTGASLKKRGKREDAGSGDEAIGALLKAVERDPADYGSWMRLVKAYIEAKKYREAVDQLNRLMLAAHGKEGFDEKEASRLLAESYTNIRNFDEARKIYSLMRQADPADPMPYLQLGRIEKETQNGEKAIKYLTKASALAPGNAEAAKELAILLFEAKRGPEALPLFKTAISLNPYDRDSHFYLGQLYLEFQNYREAYNHLLKAKNDGAHAVKSLVGIAAILNRYNKQEEALKVLSTVMKFPNMSREDLLEARYQLGETHLAMSNIAGAISQWEKISSMAPEYRDVPSKLDRYEQMRTNSVLHTYMMCTQPEFAALCESAAKKFARSIIVIRSELLRDASLEIYTQAVYREMSGPILFKFFRGSSIIGQLAVREFYEKVKEVKAKLGVCFTVADYTEEAQAFSVGRVLELHGKRELIKLLSKK